VVVEERVEAGHWRVALERPASADALIDDRAFEHDEFLPYWAELWPSAVALARHLSTLDLRGARVLEVGCGLGLPSIVAALGGADVLATDWADDALRFTERNAARNGVALATLRARWDEPDTLAGHAPFDLLVAADVLYEERNAAPLLALLDRVLAPGGTALVADPGRRHAPVFFDAARQRGWRVELVASAALGRSDVHRLWGDRR
jgi:predicted nicotinamide N-methyase